MYVYIYIYIYIYMYIYTCMYMSLDISLSCSLTVSELFCSELLETFLILSAISLPIKSPVAFAVF